MPGLFLSATHKSSGKTTVAIGLCAALAEGGLRVQPFKKGPDYIDPMWLGRAAGRACINLDPYLDAPERIAAQFARHAAGADIAIVEGNKGLYDGLALDGSNCNAALARQLKLPVVLVIDARGMTRGIAPLLLGYQAFDRAVDIAGVILNQVGGTRHEAKLRAAIEHYTDLPVLGAVAHDAQLAMSERHLGLQPDAELDDPRATVQRLGRVIGAQVDLARLRELALRAAPVTAPVPPPVAVPVAVPTAVPTARCGAATTHVRAEPVRIGIARDRAFGFYYADDLGALEAAGARLVPFDTLRDARLPAIDGLFIGGGFPEVYMRELEANASLRAELRAALAAGLPAYAECGGLMYLARSIEWNGRSARMVGAIPGDAVMHARPVGRGYVHLQETSHFPWPGGAGTELRAHEFHHSSLQNLDPGLPLAYRVTRGHGIDGHGDGVLVGNLLASYAHRRGGGDAPWPGRFVAFVRTLRARRRANAGLRVEEALGALP